MGVILEVARRTGGDGGYHPEQWEEKSTVKQRAGVWEAQVSTSEGCQEPRKPRGEGTWAQRAAALRQWDAPLFLPP